ncbi:MAG: DUF1501 domain-containing protein [Pirellulaceae bacterium]
MLTISRQNHATKCNGATRRDFLQVGTFGLGGLALGDLLRAQASAASAPAASSALRNNKSVILFWLDGGPTHFETYDPKPEAPAEYRGPFGTIETSASGIRLSEMLVEQAKVMDKVSVLRSVHHNNGDHFAAAHWMLTGYHGSNAAARDPKFPGVGAIVNRLAGANQPNVPAYVSVPYSRTVGIKPGYNSATWLGAQYNPFEVDSDPSRDNFEVKNINMPGDMTVERIDHRRNLLSSLDRIRRDIDKRGLMEGIDEFNAEAIEMVTGDAAREAFDIAAESDAMRDRYGRNTHGQSALLARRLVESGVKFVTVHNGGWDMHSTIDTSIKRRMPETDRAIGVLIQDLAERGMLDDVMVCVMGEFGRTPRVNANAGRDHWGNVMSVLLGGGGLRGGQAVGSSNDKGEHPVDTPLMPADVLATIYRVLGIDLEAKFLNHAGRPTGINNYGQPIEALL